MISKTERLLAKNSYFLTRGHDFVEIGGLRWATCNVGAENPSDPGLYFQWGDTQGYTVDQVGVGIGQKFFGWADYNLTNRKTILELPDDPVHANWGGKWRMPTTEDFAALGRAVNFKWVKDYQGSGVSGLVLTDKTDSSKVLFFPAAGYCINGSAYSVGSLGFYWSSSVYGSYFQSAYNLAFDRGGVYWQSNRDRYRGFTLRGVVGEN